MARPMPTRRALLASLAASSTLMLGARPLAAQETPAELFNELFGQIGSIVIVYDTVADLRATTEATRGTGAYWLVREGYAYTQAPTYASDHDLTTAGGIKLYVHPFGGEYNIRAFGALGDGTTDDRAAIQRAIDKGARVFVPEGIYLVTAERDTFDRAALTVGNSVSIVGEGRGSVLVLGEHTTGGHAVLSITGSGVTLQHIVLDGNRAAQPLAGDEWSHCLSILDARQVRLLHCDCINAMGDGVYVGGNTGNGSEEVLIEGCHFDNNERQGISLVMGRNLRIIGCDIANTTGSAPGAGIDIEGNPGQPAPVRGVVIQGNSIRDNYWGIVIEGTGPTDNITVTGNHFNGNRVSDILCRGQNVTISGNVIRVTSKTVPYPTVYLQDCEHIAFSGNTVIGNYGAQEREGLRIERGSNFITVSGNTFRTTTNACLLISTAEGASGTGGISNIAVTGNVMEDCGRDSFGGGAISFRGGLESIGQVSLVGNVVYDSRSGGLEAAYGIDTTNMTDADMRTVHIADNSIIGPTVQIRRPVTGWHYEARTFHYPVTLDFDLTAATLQDLTVAVPGVTANHQVQVTLPNGAAPSNVFYRAWVSAPGIVTVRGVRVSGTPDPASGTFWLAITELMTD